MSTGVTNQPLTQPATTNKRTETTDQLIDIIQKIESNKNGYLKMFLTQLKYQLPDDPMKPSDMMGQLANMGSMESAFQQAQVMAKILNVYKDNQLLQITGVVGQYAEVPASQFFFSGADPANFSYVIDRDDLNPDHRVLLSFQTTDDHPRIIGTAAGPTTPGYHQISWSGSVDEGGKPLEAGVYRIHARVVDKHGSTVKVGDKEEEINIPIRWMEKIHHSHRMQNGDIGVSFGQNLHVSVGDILRIQSDQPPGHTEAKELLNQQIATYAVKMQSHAPLEASVPLTENI